MTTPSQREDCGELDRRLRRLAESDGDDAWGHFLKVEGRFLRTVARDHVAGEHLLEDVVQEAVIRIRSALPGYHSLSDPEARGWLRSVVRHVALDLTAADRSRQAREQATVDAAVTTYDPHASPVSDPVVAERMESSLLDLPEVQHRVIVLHYFEGLSFADIASRLRLTRHHVHVLHGRALGQLRQRLVSAGAPCLSIAALVTLLEAHAAAGETSAITMTGTGAGAAKSSMLAALGWTAAGLIAVGISAGWYILDHRPSPTPSAPTPTALAAPEPAATHAQLTLPTAMAAPEPAATPAQLAFIRRFQEAHPNWRLTDAGRRLGDRGVWSVSGPWTVSEDQAQARVSVVNPGEQPHMVSLTLGPVIDPTRTARLMVGTLSITARTMRRKFGLDIIHDPLHPSPWRDVRKYVVSPSPVEAQLSLPITTSRYPVGMAVDSEKVYLLLEDDLQTQPRRPGAEGCFSLSIYTQLSLEAQIITVDDVQVYEADTSSAR